MSTSLTWTNFFDLAQPSSIVALQEELTQLRQRNADLETLLATALLRIQELEGRINQTSKNSHRPPSTDGYKKQPALPRPSGKTRGGQAGHRGDTLKAVAQADHVEVHLPEATHCGCGAALQAVPSVVEAARRQVFDLPVRLLEVTEHRVASKTCVDCGHKHLGSFPAYVRAPTQYGVRVHALLNLLNVEYALPVECCADLVASLTGQSLNKNTVQTSVERFAVQLEPSSRVIEQAILASPVAHADETGARVAGQLYWTHGLSTDHFTHLFVHAKRGKQAWQDPKSIIQDDKGVLVHDFWKSYFDLFEVEHAMCVAHLLRELKQLAEQQQRAWAGRMHEVLLRAYRNTQRGKASLNAEQLLELHMEFEAVLQQAKVEEPPPQLNTRNQVYATKGRNLLHRLNVHADNVLRFAAEDQVPFTNNQAERDIRPFKTKLKVAGCFRTLRGANLYAQIKGFCSTVRKHGRNVFDEIINVMMGQSFLLQPST